MLSKALLVALGTTASAQLLTLSTYLPSNAVLNNARIDAAGQSFSSGLDGPATYCPSQVGSGCPNVTSTILAGLSAMWVNVPGGQQVYVALGGHIAFTQAHSAYIPTGSFIGGFKNVTTLTAAAPVQIFTWKAPDNSTEGILACPNLLANSTSPIFEIYAHTPLFNETGCTELDGLLPHYLPAGTPFGAWQYI